MTFWKKALMSLACAGLLTGCAVKRDNMEIMDACLDNPSTVVIAQIEGFEKAKFYREGDERLVGFIINSAMTDDVRSTIERIDTKPLIQEGYYTSFGDTFEAHQFKVKELREPLKRSDLKDHDVREPKFAPYDFTFLRQKYDANYALILDPIRYGTMRHYALCIPQGRPKPMCVFQIYMVDLKDGSIVGHYNSDRLLDGPSDWDTPPAYQSLVDSIVHLLEKGLDDAHLYLCGGK